MTTVVSTDNLAPSMRCLRDAYLHAVRSAAAQDREALALPPASRFLPPLKTSSHQQASQRLLQVRAVP